MHAVRDHTHSLLGRTITYSPEDWAAPTRLTGWTHSHIAAHLVKGARALSGLCRNVIEGFPPGPYDTSLGKQCELLALSDGLRLQIELDTSAGELDGLLAQMADRQGIVHLYPSLTVALAELPLIRLRELVLHTFDLDPDEPNLEIDPQIAMPLLAFEAGRLPRRHGTTELIAAEGPIPSLAIPSRQETVEGPAAHLLAWLARDVRTDALVFSSQR